MAHVIYDEILQILRECKTPESVISELRRRYGGTRIYFPLREKPTITLRDTPKSLKKRHKISRSTAYNWLNSYKR